MTKTPDKEPNLPSSIKGLPCENPACDYNEPDVPLSDYKNHINRPCPACGEPLLDQETYDELVTLYEILKVLKSLSAVDEYAENDKNKSKSEKSEPKWPNDFSM